MHEDFYYFIMPSRGVAIFSHPCLALPLARPLPYRLYSDCYVFVLLIFV